MKDWCERWAEYQRWAEGHTEPDRRSPGAIMADIEFLYRLCPERVRRTDPDPGKLGIQDLYRVLALCDRELRSRSGTGEGH